MEHIDVYNVSQFHTHEVITDEATGQSQTTNEFTLEEAILLLPAQFRRPGITIKFISSITHIWESYVLQKNYYNTIDNWRPKIAYNDFPIFESKKLITSGSIADKLKEINDNIFSYDIKNVTVNLLLNTNVSSITGQFVQTPNNSYAYKLELENNWEYIEFRSRYFTGNYGFGIFNKNNELIFADASKNYIEYDSFGNILIKISDFINLGAKYINVGLFENKNQVTVICNKRNKIDSNNSQINNLFETCFYEKTTKCNGTPYKNINSDTGEIVSSEISNVYYSEIELNQDIIGIAYKTTSFNSNRGYAILKDNELLFGFHTTTNEITYINLIDFIKLGANKFRFGHQLGVSFDIKLLYKNYDKIKELEKIESKIAITFENQIIKNINNSDIDGNKQINVSTVTGKFVISNSSGVHSIEINLTKDIFSITAKIHNYSENYGYAFVDDDENLIESGKNLENAPVEMEINAANAISKGATKFRCSNADNTNSIQVKLKYIESKNINEIVSKSIKNAFTDNTIRFEFDTIYNKKINVLSENDNNILFENRKGCGLLRLAKNYSSYGNQTKLAIFFPGSGNYQSSSILDFPENMLPYIDYVTKCGYNVLMPFAWDTQTSGSNFSTPYSLGNFVKAYNYVIENYNIENDGVYIWGRSLGGSNVIAFSYFSGIKIKAVGMHSTQINNFSWLNSNALKNLKQFIFDNDENYEVTEQYLKDNLYKIVPYEGMFTNVIGLSETNMINFLLNKNSFDFSNCQRIQPFPSKIWMAKDDTNVSFTNMKKYWQSVINAGGLCEFRQMPSNYTDKNVQIANAHHITDYAGPTIDIKTSLGYDCKKINIAYIEMIEFFDRF